MRLSGGSRRLDLVDSPKPDPGPSEILIEVGACGVCRTDLHIIDGELANPKPDLVPGHEVVGTVIQVGREVTGFKVGERVGVPWLGWTCGRCDFCRSGRENLCVAAEFTGYTRDGGYAEYMVADARYCFHIPGRFSDAEAAPLLCAGLIGYRSYRMTGAGRRLGLYGFGAAAHIVAQIARYEEREVYAFTRAGDRQSQEFALRLGAVWAGDSTEKAPAPLDAAIIFAPVGSLVPLALASVDKGGVVVCGGIHMSDIPAFPYRLLWEERSLRSVANLTREDGDGLMRLAAEVPIRTSVQTFPLEQAGLALDHLRAGQIEGAAVLSITGRDLEKTFHQA
jgi:propanol-preferring alcohol dehydrogenase